MTTAWYCLRFVALCALLGMTLCLSAAGKSRDPRPQVLVLHSSYRGFPWTDQIEQGITDTLAREQPQPEVYIEYLDLYRHQGSGYHTELLQLFQEKYHNQRFDAIVCTDDPALQFMLDYRDALFPGTPVIFCGINNFKETLIAGHAGYTGVSETIDVQGTLDVALRLHPGTKTVVVIGDRQKYYRDNRDQLLRVMPAYRGRVEFQFLEGFPLSSLRKQLPALPPHTLVLLISQLWNRRGEQLPPGPATQRLAEACPYPIYTCWDFFLDHGTVGGKVISGYSQGAAAAELAVRILHGTPVSAIPVVMHPPTQYMFDYRALSRFGIAYSQLPAGSIILHKPRTWYVIDRQLLWSGIALFIVLVNIILLLLAAVRQRRRAEERLREANGTLSALIDASPLAIVSCDMRGCVTLWNSAAETLFGWQADEVLGRRLPTVPQEKQEEYRALVETILTGKGFRDLEAVRQRKDGSQVDLRASAAPFYDRHGKACGFVTLLADITERKRMEEQKRLLLLMQEQEQLRSEFLSCVSHELKTPLTPIMAGLEMLKDQTQPTGEIWQKFTQTLYEQGLRLQSLITDLLNLFQTESGQLVLHPEPVDLPALIEQSLTAYRPSFAERGLYCRYAGGEEMPRLIGDPRRLGQVLDNLLSNALKCTIRGGATIRTRMEDGMVRLEISDTGIGLAPEETERIFQRFYQVNHHQPGVGLGLAVVRTFVEAHGGTIHAESPGPGQGSTFVVQLPVGVEAKVLVEV